MIIDIMMHRFEFIERHSKGIVLDVGCHNSQQWYYPMPKDSITNPPMIKDIILIDCDVWKNPFDFKFIRCLAENIPLKDKSIDTVVFGDILEHVKDPDILLKEAKRLTRDRIIISVPNEYKWDKRNISFETRDKLIARGEDLDKLCFSSTIGHESNMCSKALNDTKFKHIFHTKCFSDEIFEKMIKDNFNSGEWKWHLYNVRYAAHNYCNLVAIIWRDNER